MKENKLVCIVGLTGSGKTEIADYFKEQGYSYVRFGQLTLDEVAKRGLEPTEENERPIREAFRAEHGPAAFAILNMPKFDEGLAKGNVIGDGLYSWSEYKVLKETNKYSLLQIQLFTGRKHQIRVHFSEKGHAVVGDKMYGEKEAGIQRLALHSASIEFKHPFSKKPMVFSTDLPPFFNSLIH